MKKFVLGLSLLVLASLGISKDAVWNESVPDQYVVKKGDTLWDISAVYLRDPWMWPEIWYINQQIENPHLIYPGDIIKLVYIDGQQKLTVQRGRDVKLSPEIRKIEHAEAISALPLDIIDKFLRGNRVVTDAELNAAPYVLGGMEKKLLIGINDDFFARGDFSDSYTSYGLYRRGDPYIDPKTGEVLGIRAKDVGSARLKAVDGGIATLRATRAPVEIRAPDRLLVSDPPSYNTTFYPKAPDADIQGVIISVEGEGLRAGMLDVVAINRGAREGVKPGDTFAVYKDGETITDRVTKKPVKLPDEHVGLIMVFYTYEKLSYALVMAADRQVDINDPVRNP